MDAHKRSDAKRNMPHDTPERNIARTITEVKQRLLGNIRCCMYGCAGGVIHNFLELSIGE